jgi:biopolymer transport protein ExbD
MPPKLRTLQIRRDRDQDAALNLTPFLNLLVILIPFLLVGVVFSRIAVLDLNLPAAQENPAAKDHPPFQLVVTLHSDSLLIAGSHLNTTRLPKIGGSYDLKRLSTLLRELKTRFPEERGIIVLSEADIPYDSLIQVMDTCRNDGPAELYPEVTLGEVRSS